MISETLLLTNMEKAALELESKFDDTEKRLDKVYSIHPTTDIYTWVLTMSIP